MKELLSENTHRDTRVRTLNISSFYVCLVEFLCAELPWSLALAMVQTQTLSTNAILRQKFSLEHVYAVSNADGENKRKAVLREFLSKGSRLI